MKPRCSVFAALSLDGFLARTDGSMDWLEKIQSEIPADEDGGFSAFLNGIDAIVMGRKTFEHIRTFRPWPYQGKPLFVLASVPPEIPEDLSTQIFHACGPLPALFTTLGQAGYQHLYLDGGTVIRTGLAADLIDDLTLTLVPILLGTGLPLFGPGAERHLRLRYSRVIPPGLVQNSWEVIRHAQ